MDLVNTFVPEYLSAAQILQPGVLSYTHTAYFKVKINEKISQCPDLVWNPKHMRDKLILPLIKGEVWPADFAAVSVASGKARQGLFSEETCTGYTVHVSIWLELC